MHGCVPCRELAGRMAMGGRAWDFPMHAYAQLKQRLQVQPGFRVKWEVSGACHAMPRHVR